MMIDGTFPREVGRRGYTLKDKATPNPELAPTQGVGITEWRPSARRGTGISLNEIVGNTNGGVKQHFPMN